MARTAITKVELGREVISDSIAFTTMVNDGAYYDWNKPDEKIVVAVKNANTATTNQVVVKLGQGLGVTSSDADLVLDVEPSALQVVQLESWKYKQLSGDDKGRCLLDASTTSTTAELSVAVIALK